MATNRRAGKRVPKWVRYEEQAGARIDPGPHIAIVKNTYDPFNSGRLSVWIPFLGGDPDDPHNQRIVQYASPFFGHTNFQEAANGHPNSNTTFETVRHTYGMWFTPPDINVRVLVMFANGNPNHGYWFACIPPVAEHHQAASSGGAPVADLENDAQVSNLISEYAAEFAPAVDINGTQDAANSYQALQEKKAPHRVQAKILAEQGLLADSQRGIDGATTSREAPSGAFGVTTPGRIYEDQVTDDLLQQIDGVTVDYTKFEPKVDTGRKGGHQFIMDDGDDQGNSRRVKMRTAAGHQIIMDDTAGMLYVSTSTGKNWIELSNDGQMMIYSESDISVRTGGDMNVKVDGNFNHEVNGDYNVKVRGNMKTEVDGNREEIVTGDKDVDLQSNYSTNVASNINVEAGAKYSVKSADDMALETGANWGVKVADEATIDSGALSGWKCADVINLEGTEIGLNSGPPGSPASVTAPTVPQAFTLADLNDSTKIGDIWKHESPSSSTGQTMLPKITTHEPYDSRVITPLQSSTGTPSKRV